MSEREAPELDLIWDEAKRDIDQGDYNKAIDVYNYVLVRDSDSTKAVEHASVYLGDLLLTSRQRLDRADKHLKNVIASSPDNAHCHYLLGSAYSVRERFSEAVDAPMNAIPQFALANNLGRRGDWPARPCCPEGMR